MREKILFSLFGLVLLAGPALAEAQSDSGAPQLSAGYSALHESLDGEGFWDNGFTGDAVFVFGGRNSARLGAVAQFTTHRNSDFDDTLVAGLGGLRIAFGTGRLEPFAQLLLGAEHCCDPGQYGFAIQPGFGLTGWFSSVIGARATVDFRTSRYTDPDFDTSKWYSEPIIGASIVVRLGY
ncbi:MAG: hypothetical protein ACRD2N_16240 [Vicinamibacterales bacterium]